MHYSVLPSLISLFVLLGCQSSQDLPISPVSRLNSINHAQKTISLRDESLPYLKIEAIKTPTKQVHVISAPAHVDFRSQALSNAGAMVSGRINKVLVQVGDKVKAGEPLATMLSYDASQMHSAYTQAEIELTKAKDKWQRQVDMQHFGVGLDVERVAAQAELEQAKTELARSANALRLLGDEKNGEITIRAPIDATILKNNISIGFTVEPGTSLFELGEPSKAWIVADVFEQDLPLIDIGAKAHIELVSFNQSIIGKVIKESAMLESHSRRASVFIAPESSTLALRPGMYARVLIETNLPGQIILPTTAILVKNDQETVVYVEIAPNTFEARTVHVGPSRDGLTPVFDGLAGTERIVVSGALLLDGEASLLL